MITVMKFITSMFSVILLVFENSGSVSGDRVAYS